MDTGAGVLRAGTIAAVMITLASLRRHPVKSLLGEAVAAADLSERGVAGDRAYALLDTETGLIASAKQPRLWRALVTAAASVTADGVRVAFPDGSTVDGPSADLDEALSKLTGRSVRLIDTPPRDARFHRSIPEEVLDRGVEAEVGSTVSTLGAVLPGTFFDFAPVHLITTSTLARIGELSPRGTVEAERYRPNLVLDTGTDGGFVEDAWTDRVLAIGEARLRVLVPSPRCAIPTLAHGGLPQDGDALRVLAKHHRVQVGEWGVFATAGVYAMVERGGTVRTGDAVELTG